MVLRQENTNTRQNTLQCFAGLIFAAFFIGVKQNDDTLTNIYVYDMVYT